MAKPDAVSQKEKLFTEENIIHFHNPSSLHCESPICTSPEALKNIRICHTDFQVSLNLLDNKNGVVKRLVLQPELTAKPSLALAPLDIGRLVGDCLEVLK